MRDVLLAEVTLKIKKPGTQNSDWTLWNSVAFIFCYFPFDWNITVCIPFDSNAALLEIRHSECEMAGIGSFFLYRGTGEALLWFTSLLTLSLCAFLNVIAISAQSAIALCQHPVAMTTYPQTNAPNSVTACTSYGAWCPLSIMFL